MFGIPDNYVTYEEIEALIKDWKGRAENERQAALRAKREGDPVIAEGCFGGVSVYKTCIAGLIKLIGYTPNEN